MCYHALVSIVETRRVVPIVRKVNLIIIISLVTGIGAITVYTAASIFSIIGGTTEDNLVQQSNLLFAAIENSMLDGKGSLVVTLFDSISETNPDYDIALYRRNGRRAFSDNTTILAVNQVLFDAGLSFEPRATEDPEEPVMRDAEFLRAVGASGIPDTQFSRIRREEGTRHFRILRPLLNLPSCSDCHGSLHTIRGVIDIQNDITKRITRQWISVGVSAAFFLVGVLVLAVVLSTFLRGTIIRPVKQIGEVCTDVTQGSFGRRVEFRSNDEIGVLGDTVNTMVQGLYERYELSKFVSASTISSIGDSDSGAGRKVDIAILFSDIRGFTSYSESSDPARVVDSLNRLLSVQTEIIHDCGGDVDKYVGDEIVAIFTGGEGVKGACTAAVRIQSAVEAESREHFDGLHVGVGVNAGEVILGMVGSQTRADYTIIGDNVNVTSRLCDVAKPGQVLVSESVSSRVGSSATVEGPFGVSVKGKARKLRVYVLKGMEGES